VYSGVFVPVVATNEAELHLLKNEPIHKRKPCGNHEDHLNGTSHELKHKQNDHLPNQQ